MEYNERDHKFLFKNGQRRLAPLGFLGITYSGVVMYAFEDHLHPWDTGGTNQRLTKPEKEEIALEMIERWARYGRLNVSVVRKGWKSAKAADKLEGEFDHEHGDDAQYRDIDNPHDDVGHAKPEQPQDPGDKQAKD